MGLDKAWQPVVAGVDPRRTLLMALRPGSGDTGTSPWLVCIEIAKLTRLARALKRSH